MHKPSDYGHSFGEPTPLHGRSETDNLINAAWWETEVDEAPEPRAAFTEPLQARRGPLPDAGEKTQPDPAAPAVGMELATFRLVYESSRICIFETRDGHLTTVAVDRLA